MLKMPVIKLHCVSSIYTVACPPVRGDNPRALASGLSYVQVDKHDTTILDLGVDLAHLRYFMLKLVRVV